MLANSDLKADETIIIASDCFEEISKAVGLPTLACAIHLRAIAKSNWMKLGKMVRKAARKGYLDFMVRQGNVKLAGGKYVKNVSLDSIIEEGNEEVELTFKGPVS